MISPCRGCTDTHLPQATVREALLFSARLRQPEPVPSAELEAEYVCHLITVRV
jgi:ABC-type multidrug transport system ATPase subunit